MINQLKLTSPEKLEKETENEVLAALFPKGKDIRWKEIIDAETPSYEMEELKEAVYGMKKGKASGMDGLTAEIWKDVWETCPQQVAVFPKQVEEGKGSVNKETGEAGKLVQLL